MGTCLKQGNKMNANGFCVKQGQDLKNYHSNFPLIAAPASSPGTDIFPKGTPSTAPSGVLIEAGFPIGFSGSGMSLMKLGIWGPGPSPGPTSFQEERPEYSSQRCFTRGSPTGFLGSGDWDVPYKARDLGSSSKTGAGFGIESIHARWCS